MPAAVCDIPAGVWPSVRGTVNDGYQGQIECWRTNKTSTALVRNARIVTGRENLRNVRDNDVIGFLGTIITRQALLYAEDGKTAGKNLSYER